MCPVCTCRDDPAPLFVKHGHPILRCPGCGHRFAAAAPAPDHVARVYGDDYFTGGGAGYGDYLGEGPLLRAHGQFYARIVARHRPPGTVLDVGAAAGFVLQGLIDGGWTGGGIEPNAAMAEHARSVLGVPVTTGAFEAIEPTAPVDLVSMIQVIAHFPDPRLAVQLASAWLKPGGLLLVETWDRSSWTARVLGRHWHEYSPPSVLHWFSRAGLARLAGSVGFRALDRGRPVKRLNGAHAKSLLRYKLAGLPLGRTAARLLDLVPDRLVLRYPAEDLFWMLFEKPA